MRTVLSLVAKAEDVHQIKESGTTLYVAREPPSTSLATVLVLRISPSLVDHSQVKLALLPCL